MKNIFTYLQIRICKTLRQRILHMFVKSPLDFVFKKFIFK